MRSSARQCSAKAKLFIRMLMARTGLLVGIWKKPPNEQRH